MHEECWKYWYGDKEEVIDPYGYKIRREDFGSAQGIWNVDHIWPYSKSGLTIIENGMPISYDANESKAGLIESVVAGKVFKVEKITTKNVLIGSLWIDGKEIIPQK